MIQKRVYRGRNLEMIQEYKIHTLYAVKSCLHKCVVDTTVSVGGILFYQTQAWTSAFFIVSIFLEPFIPMYITLYKVEKGNSY